jgi:hypothetical protein
MDLIKKPWSTGINANKIQGKSMLSVRKGTFFVKSKWVHGKWIKHTKHFHCIFLLIEIFIFESFLVFC